MAEHSNLGDHEAEMCPRCQRQRLVRLRSMARHSELDWFKCDGCEHLFTRPRPTLDIKLASAASAPTSM